MTTPNDICPICKTQGKQDGTIGDITGSSDARPYYECPKCGNGWTLRKDGKGRQNLK